MYILQVQEDRKRSFYVNYIKLLGELHYLTTQL